MITRFTILLILISLSVFSQSNLSSYLFGGGSTEYSYEHCFDADGNFIVIGVVKGNGMYFTDTIGNPDFLYKNIFIRKYTQDMSTLLVSTIIGGSGHDYSKSVDIDSEGNVFIGGFTLSSDVPVSASAYQQTNNSVGNYEGYIIKLNADLNQLLAATYFGGEEEDKLYKLRIDEDDNVVIVGNTLSSNNIATVGSFDEDYNGTTGSLFDFGDGYIAKLDNNLENIIAGTYIGGTGDEACYSMLINSDNNIVITGGTTSTDYPTSLNAFGTIALAGFDIILTELNSDLTQLIHSTLVAGNGDDIGWDVAYNYNDNKYIIGAQTGSNFNISGTVADPTANGSSDGFIVIINGNMENIHSATFVGGAQQDLVTSVYYNGNSIIYGGITESDNLLTSSDAYYPNYLDENDFADGFYGSIGNNLSEFNHLSYFGGNDDDHIWKVSSYENKIYVNGTTYSANVESDSILGGSSDGIIGIVENIYVNIEDVNNENVSIENLVQNISIYPNPTSDFVKASSQNIISSIEIVNINGQVMFAKTYYNNEKSQTVDVRELEKGTYVIRINNKQNLSTIFIIE